MSAQISPQLRYLDEAAHLLHMGAPETSSHLVSQRNQLLRQHDIAQTDVQRQHVCGACGNIMIPGLEIKLELESRRPRTKRKGKTEVKSDSVPVGPVKVLTCNRCAKSTRIRLPAPGPAHRRKATKPSLPGKNSALDAEAPKKLTANATSKKRAKNRKTGLQALLSNQPSQSTAKSLSLADFAKK